MMVNMEMYPYTLKSRFADLSGMLAHSFVIHIHIHININNFSLFIIICIYLGACKTVVDELDGYNKSHNI